MDPPCPCPISVIRILERRRRAWKKGEGEGRSDQERIKQCLFSPSSFEQSKVTDISVQMLILKKHMGQGKASCIFKLKSLISSSQWHSLLLFLQADEGR